MVMSLIPQRRVSTRTHADGTFNTLSTLLCLTSWWGCIDGFLRGLCLCGLPTHAIASIPCLSVRELTNILLQAVDHWGCSAGPIEQCLDAPLNWLASSLIGPDSYRPLF